MNSFVLILLLVAPLCSPALPVSTALQAVSKGTPSPVKLIYPTGLALDDQGNVYISDIGTHRILKLDRQGHLTAIAGTGEGGYSGDGGPAVKASLFAPHDVTFDAEGNLLIADTFNHRIRRINRQGIITTIAGNGKAAYSGDHGPALQASLNNPQSIALDREGNLLIADTYNYVVRRVDRQGTMTTFAGTEPGFAGDGGPASKAQISLPMAVAVGPDGSVYISDAGNSRIRRVAPDGKIQTIVGYGGGSGLYGAGFTGDNGPSEKAKVFSAAGLKCDEAGNLYISDSGNNRIRVIRGGVITTIIGSGRAGFGGDESKALEAALNTPQKIALAKDGSLLIADRVNHRIRKVDTSGVIHTIAGEDTPTGMIIAPKG